MPATADARAGRAAFTHPGFVLFQIARFLIVAAVEMQAVAVGWQVYEITKRPLDLGYVGLAQFLPAILLVPDLGTRIGSVRAAPCSLGLLWRVCRLFCTAARSCRARGALDYFDLHCAGSDRNREIVQQHSEPVDPAAACSGRALSECSGVERKHLSGSNDSRTFVRRHPLRSVPRAVCRLCGRHGDGDRGDALIVPHQARSQSACCASQ